MNEVKHKYFINITMFQSQIKKESNEKPATWK